MHYVKCICYVKCTFLKLNDVTYYKFQLFVVKFIYKFAVCLLHFL